MSSNNIPPPSIIEDVLVIEYAVVDETVEFTGRLKLYVGENQINAVPRLAICQHPVDHTFFLMHCDEKWNVLGIQVWNAPDFPEEITLEGVKQRAEVYYKGISSKWRKFK